MTPLFTVTSVRRLAHVSTRRLIRFGMFATVSDSHDELDPDQVIWGSFPENVRKCVYKMKIEKLKAEKEKERETSKRERAEKEHLMTMMSLEKLTDSFSLMNPRNIIEYVEQFVMSPTSANLKRADRWMDYFASDVVGIRILKCILKTNKGIGWHNASGVANKLAAVYSLASDPAHASSHEIAADQTIQLMLSDRSGVQVLNAMACIGSELGLSIALPTTSAPVPSIAPSAPAAAPGPAGSVSSSGSGSVIPP